MIIRALCLQGGSPLLRVVSKWRNMKITTVDEFIKYKVLPEHRDIVDFLRKMMRDVAPNAI